MIKDLKQSIRGLKGAVVRLFFSDNQFIEGTLIAVKEDHLVVDANERIFYIALKQLYGISKNAKDNRVARQIPAFIDKNHLTDVLNSMKYNIITINGMYDKLFEGLLISISEDCIMLVNRDELHFINYSSIFNVFDGIYEQEKIQRDNSPELGKTVKQKTEPLIETPAILIPLNLEPLQDKIAESSFLEKNPSSSEENIHEINLLEMKATELSINEYRVLKSDGNSPMSSLEKPSVENGLDNRQENVYFESNDSSQPEINEVVLSTSAESKIKVSNDAELKLIAVKKVENEIVNETKTSFKPDLETKEVIEEKFIQQPEENEIDDQLNSDLQPLCHVEDKSTDLETKETIEEVVTEQNEMLTDKFSVVPNAEQEDLFTHESHDNKEYLNEKELCEKLDPNFNQKDCTEVEVGSNSLMNSDSEILAQSTITQSAQHCDVGGTLLNKKFNLIGSLSKHKIKQSFETDNVSFESVTHSISPMQHERDRENLMTIPCLTQSLETEETSDRLQMENHQSTMDDKVLFEAQYFALMKHAERMMDTIDSSQNAIKNMSPEGKVIIRNQYFSLFKSAKKMYNQLNEKHNKKFVRM
ncbi:DUF2642 domain-containing protein [Ureibacillus aquaedulcis]|uniref:DUF2642 domain-containing protein n=1 Tax=Ureibacillus aquaedulcis TaxID=3058421 RepID=A0ABT8GPB1_9BACL|nr:DUF2642 domain-containing protein [Ureibacillus sp. BA0131]MDN4492746.1 DUF2642 domain-containing protein [Ureibacillus sp. BA0131]